MATANKKSAIKAAPVKAKAVPLKKSPLGAGLKALAKAATAGIASNKPTPKAIPTMDSSLAQAMDILKSVAALDGTNESAVLAQRRRAKRFLAQHDSL